MSHSGETTCGRAHYRDFVLDGSQGHGASPRTPCVESMDMGAPMHVALFDHPDLDLSTPIDPHREQPTMLEWQEPLAAQWPYKHRILAEYSEGYRDGRHP